MFRAFALLFLLAIVSPVSAFAAPNFTLTPMTKSVKVGEDFQVVVGLNSGSKTTTMYDVVLKFDATKLEVKDAVISESVPRGMDFRKIIENSAGKFSGYIFTTGTNPYEEQTYSGDLIKLTLSAKTTGTATLTFDCKQGTTAESFAESNILHVVKQADSSNLVSEDIIVCADNQTGTYTVSAASASTTTATPTSTTSTTTSTTATSTPRTSTPTTAPTSLPQSGSASATIGLVVLGIATVILGGVSLRL